MIESLVRPHYLRFEPYHSARSEVRNAEHFLDANELACGSPVTFRQVPLHRYPDPAQIDLRRELGKRLGFSESMIFTGVGSDEIIDLLIRLFCEPGKEKILVNEPTYGVYRVAADVNAVETIVCDLNISFQIDVNWIYRNITPDIKIIFFCSPNNPTGNLLRRADILALCDSFKGIVVVDEAYIDFAEEGASVINEVKRRKNLVILRTMSKSYGLAGIRLGYCVADSEVINFLLRIKAPYNINSVTSALALEALRDNSFVQSAVKEIRKARQWMERELAGLPRVVRIYPSDANFLLVEVNDAEKIYRYLADHGIIVRKRSEPRLRSCLRITVGNDDENRKVVELIGKIS